VQAMIKLLLPGVEASSDAADALAVAICHAHHAATRERLGGVMAGGAR
jgi:crossover junction endodeoxyribonuclease RuvC